MVVDVEVPHQTNAYIGRHRPQADSCIQFSCVLHSVVLPEVHFVEGTGEGTLHLFSKGLPLLSSPLPGPVLPHPILPDCRPSLSRPPLSSIPACPLLPSPSLLPDPSLRGPVHPYPVLSILHSPQSRLACSRPPSPIPRSRPSPIPSARCRRQRGRSAAVRRGRSASGPTFAPYRANRAVINL